METFFKSFYDTITEDPRIGVTHVSLYMALMYQCTLNKGSIPFCISRDGIMKAAKINARQTYNKCINDLQEFGYIKYSPSTNVKERSLVWLKRL